MISSSIEFPPIALPPYLSDAIPTQANLRTLHTPSALQTHAKHSPIIRRQFLTPSLTHPPCPEDPCTPKWRPRMLPISSSFPIDPTHLPPPSFSTRKNPLISPPPQRHPLHPRRPRPNVLRHPLGRRALQALLARTASLEPSEPGAPSSGNRALCRQDEGV